MIHVYVASGEVRPEIPHQDKTGSKSNANHAGMPAYGLLRTGSESYLEAEVGIEPA